MERDVWLYYYSVQDRLCNTHIITSYCGSEKVHEARNKNKESDKVEENSGDIFSLQNEDVETVLCDKE